MMNKSLNNIVGLFTSYFTSLGMVFTNAGDIGNWLLAIIPAVAGAWLTIKIAKVRDAEAERIHLENDEKRLDIEERKLKLKLKQQQQDNELLTKNTEDELS